MNEKEIILKWQQGLSKNQLAKIYKREYNQTIKIVRTTVRHRHAGRFISNYEALRKVELTIYDFIKNGGDTNDNQK